MSEWFITDDDCLQACRQIPDNQPNYDFVQINSYPGHVDGKPFYQIAHGSVRVLSDYSEEEILSALASYGYSDMDDFVFQNSPNKDFVYKEDGSLDRENSPSYIIDYQLIAEMLFEIENQEFVDEEFPTWNEAVQAVANITGLDLNQYMEKELFLVIGNKIGEESLSKFIMTAEDLASSYPGLVLTPIHQKVSLHDPVNAASRIADFIDNTSPQGAMISITAKAENQLPELMQPILDADIGRDRHMHPMIAIKWGFEHLDYVKDLDTIFSKLGLLEVKRNRPSVTQGDAAVLCNGREIVRYGDDIKLHATGSHDIFSGVTTNEPQYGDVINGWGSVKPDEQFRRAALTQYGRAIVKAMTPSKTLDQMIASAQARIQGGETGRGSGKGPVR